jgi:hypothetical protein
MVTPRRRGASKFGCLLSLVLFGAAIYYGAQLGKVYWRYYEFQEDIRTAARFARTQTDQVIYRNLVSSIDALGIPAEAKRLVIRRVGPPFTIQIRTEYRERIDLPLGRVWYIRFRPRAESRF